MRRIAAALLFISLILWSNCFADTRPLKVGVILPLSGKAASVGISIKNGVSMAYEKLPAAARASLELRFEDDAAESRQSVAAAQKLMAEDKVDLLVTAFSNAGNSVVPITERAGLPLLSLAYDRGISDGKKAAFTFWVDVNDLAASAVAEAVQRGYKKVAVVSTLHEGNRAMRDNLLHAGAGKLDFPSLEEVQLADTDLNTHVLRLKADAPADSIALLMHSGHLGLFIRSLRANGVNLPLFTLGNFEDLNVRTTAGAELKGQWYSAGDYAPWFLPAYRKAFPNDSTFGAAFGYDAVLLMAQIAGKGLTQSEIPAFLSTAKVNGGAFPEVLPDGKNGFRFPVITKIVGQDGIPPY